MLHLAAPTHNPTSGRDFELLLSTWNRHQDLRKAGAPVSELAESRARLDQARGLTSIQSAA